MRNWIEKVCFSLGITLLVSAWVAMPSQLNASMYTVPCMSGCTAPACLAIQTTCPNVRIAQDGTNLCDPPPAPCLGCVCRKITGIAGCQCAPPELPE